MRENGNRTNGHTQTILSPAESMPRVEPELKWDSLAARYKTYRKKAEFWEAMSRDKTTLSEHLKSSLPLLPSPGIRMRQKEFDKQLDSTTGLSHNVVSHVRDHLQRAINWTYSLKKGHSEISKDEEGNILLSERVQSLIQWRQKVLNTLHERGIHHGSAGKKFKEKYHGMENMWVLATYPYDIKRANPTFQIEYLSKIASGKITGDGLFISDDDLNFLSRVSPKAYHPSSGVYHSSTEKDGRNDVLSKEEEKILFERVRRGHAASEVLAVGGHNTIVRSGRVFIVPFSTNTSQTERDQSTISDPKTQNLLSWIRAGYLASNDIFKHNRSLVLSIMRGRYEIPREKWEECLRSANACLYKSIALYDSNKAGKFSTYATPWIVKGILEELYADRALPLSRHVEQDISRIKHIRSVLQKGKESQVTPEEIADYWMQEKIQRFVKANHRRPKDFEIKKLQITSKRVARLLKLDHDSQHVNQNSPGDDENSTRQDNDGLWGNSIHASINMDDALIQNELRVEENRLLESALSKLNNADRMLLQNRYGLGDREISEMSLEEIGLELQLSKQAVQARERKVLNKLRIIMNELQSQTLN